MTAIAGFVVSGVRKDVYGYQICHRCAVNGFEDLQPCVGVQLCAATQHAEALHLLLLPSSSYFYTTINPAFLNAFRFLLCSCLRLSSSTMILPSRPFDVIWPRKTTRRKRVATPHWHAPVHWKPDLTKPVAHSDSRVAPRQQPPAWLERLWEVSGGCRAW